MGLLAGTPVHVGAGDTHVSCLGVDGVEAGRVVIVAGSTTPIQLTAAEPACDMAARPWVSPHVWPDRWAVEMNVGATGMLYTWLRDLCRTLGSEQAAPDYAALDALAASSPRGARDLLVTAPQPLWGEDAWSSAAPMTMFGLSPAHSLGDVARAVLESICYGIRGNLEQLEGVHGRTFEDVVLTGGGSRSPLWVQMLADVLGKEVRVPLVTEAPARAGARLVVKDDPGAVAPPLPITVYHPDPAATAAYSAYCERYFDVHHGLRVAFGGAH
jgi:sugar (pentulose or hexulose) kinase